MSRIALVVHGNLPIGLLSILRCATGASMSEMRGRAQARRPVLEADLFQNDHLQVAHRLRSILEYVDESSIALSVYELEPEEPFETASLEARLIDSGTLENILSTAHGQFS